MCVGKLKKFSSQTLLDGYIPLWILLYICTSVNAQTFDFPPTSFTQQPQGGMEIAGNTKVLLCHANANPPAVYAWTRNGVLLQQRNPSATALRIERIERADIGRYGCIASNSGGAIRSNPVQVDVAYMVPYSQSSHTERRVATGSAAVLDPPPLDSYPPASIQWAERSVGTQWPYHYRQVAPHAQRYHVTLSQQLVILETRRGDDGKIFRATAVNNYVGQTNYTFVLHLTAADVSESVDIPPHVVVPLVATTAIQGEDTQVVFECVANARPLSYLRLNWYKLDAAGERHAIVTNRQKYVLSMYRRKLTILQPAANDSATYVCEAVFDKPGGGFRHPPDATAANLTVYTKPSFRGQPSSEIRKDFGMTVTIPCSAVGLPKLVFQWYRNAVPIVITTDSRYVITDDGDLQIADVKPEDGGMYQCFVSNAAGQISAATWLRVLSSRPEVTTGPEDVSVIAGESARFECRVTGAPKPVVTWHKVNGEERQLLTGGAGSRLELLGTELLIPRTVVSDGGQYVCSATNSIGTATAAARLTVTLRTTIATPPKDMSVVKGSTARQPCGVRHDASVAVTWTWYHDDVEVTAADRRKHVLTDGTLETRSVRNQDVGLYRCEVTSDGGNATASARLEIIELPHAPAITLVQLSAESNRAADVEWEPGFDGNSPIISFVVQFRRVPEGVKLSAEEGWQTAAGEIAAGGRRHTVVDLQPARSYQFRVSAVNGVGRGAPSAPSDVVQLPQQPPSAPPRDVVASPRADSSTAVLVQWRPPVAEAWNGALRGYTLRFMPAGYPAETLSLENVTDPTATSHALTDLIEFQQYQVAVAAFNRKGVGVYSHYVYVRTAEGVPIAPPTALAVVALNSTALKASWKPPEPGFINGINQGYKITAKPLDTPGGVVVRQTVLSDTSNMLGTQTSVLAHLQKYARYTVSVVCFTSQGDGPRSDAVTTRTSEDVPDHVSSLQFDKILDVSLVVMWTPPDHINGILLGYVLNYLKKDQPITKVTHSLSVATHNFSVSALTATTAYTFEVLATTAVGHGAAVVKDVVTGVPPVLPEAPFSLSVTEVANTSVLLSFVPGFKGHAEISRWLIESQQTEVAKDASSDWLAAYDVYAPAAVHIRVLGLRPHTLYRLRMLARNAAGTGAPSQPSPPFRTLPSPPARPPSGLTVRPFNETALRVGWTPLPTELWYGDERGYRLDVRPAAAGGGGGGGSFTLVREGGSSGRVVAGLREWRAYVVRVAAYNRAGSSAWSGVVRERTREAVPSSGPANVTAVAVNSTSIKVSWSSVPFGERNGDIQGYKVEYQEMERQGAASHQQVNGSATYSALLASLRKFVTYEVRVLAYTRVGDGAASVPALTVRTFEDVPGPPSRVSFPVVTHTTARVIWDPPTEPNGLIVGYRVMFREDSDPPIYATVDDTLAATARYYDATGLQRNKYYVFSVKAKTSLGWGEPATVHVYTIMNRRSPEPPSQPQVLASGVADRSVTFSWQPGADGGGPVRNYSVAVQEGDEGKYITLSEGIGHGMTAYTVTGLRPNTKYRFRVAAYNDIGPSLFSIPSRQVTTMPAAPDSPPTDLEVVPMSRTSALVTWTPPPRDTWNGALQGYRVQHRELLDAAAAAAAGGARGADASAPWRSEMVLGAGAVSHVVRALRLFQTYELRVRAYNTYGHSDWGGTAHLYLEIVPGGPPQSVAMVTRSATSIVVSWQPLRPEHHNGDILGYKVYYWAVAENRTTVIVQTVSSSVTELTLSGLLMYTQYTAVIAAFNAAGDGPNSSQPLLATTSQGVPGAPGPLTFIVLSLTSLNVTWLPPAQPNGVILHYEVSYYQANYADGERHSMQVKIAGEKLHYVAQKLSRVRYAFKVRAQTAVGWGPARIQNMSTAPQLGSPPMPSRPQLELRETFLIITWMNGYEGDAPVHAFIIQQREKDTDMWLSLVIKLNSSHQSSVNVSLSLLTVNREFQFRVITINRHGVSHPSPPSAFLKVPDVNAKKFYQQYWFLIIVALLGVIFIIVVVSVLCFTGKLRKSKYKARKDMMAAGRGEAVGSVPATTLHLAQNGTMAPPMSRPMTLGTAAAEDGGFSTYETRQSQRRQSRRQPPRNNALPPYIRSPPRPSPGSVIYSDESAKADDDTSLTDKPSEGSSCSTEGSDEDGCKPVATPSNFTNHYVNGDVHQSWMQHRPSVSRGGATGGAGAAAAASNVGYADSDADSSQYAMTLNGGHILMNNMAGSRTPLAGYSSFV